MDLLFEGIIRGLETVSDVLEYGPTEAVKINTSLSPEAERSYREIMKNLDNSTSDNSTSDNSKTVCQELIKNDVDEFKELIEAIKKELVQSDGCDLNLIYNYHQLNAYGKAIMEVISPDQCSKKDEPSMEKQIETALFFKQKLGNCETSSKS